METTGPIDRVSNPAWFTPQGEPTAAAIADAFDNAKREGAGLDVPEGRRFIRLTDTLARLISERLRSLSAWVGMVAEFHRAADMPLEPKPIALQTFDWHIGVRDEKTEHETLRRLRMRLLVEEFTEYQEAEEAHDIVEIADALGDMIYVICGTAHAYGIDLERVVAEIHRSNMTKVVDGKVRKREDGKILKPGTYEPPNIEKALGIDGIADFGGEKRSVRLPPGIEEMVRAQNERNNAVED